MDQDTMFRGIDLAFVSKHDTVEITFFGGEPLLEMDSLRSGVAYAEERGRASGKHVTYSISTNGLLLDDDAVDFLAQHRFHTQLSFDGVAPMQKLRGTGTFDTLDRLLDEIGERHPNFLHDCLHISMTLVPRTIPYFADSIEYFIGKGMREIGVNPSISMMMDWKLERIEELEEQFAQILEISLLHYSATEEIPLKVFRGGSTSSHLRPDSTTMCGVMRGEEPAVDVDGQVHGCATFVPSFQKFRSPFLRDRIQDMRIGDLRAPDFQKRYRLFAGAVKRAEIFHHKEEKYSGYGRCGDCRFLGACAICPMSIGNLPGNRDPRRIPDFACAFNLVALKHRDLFWDRIDHEPFAAFSRETPAELVRIHQVAVGAQKIGK
jgi:sulfatase maturation enzyme AslB (radical SAM superfamily)